MDLYKIKSLGLVLTIYLIAFLPSYILFIVRKAENRRSLINSLCLSSIMEILIFSLLYVYTREAFSIFNAKINIENYAVYAAKILFITSSITPIHYLLPLTLFRNKKKKKAVLLFSLKLFYIPIFIFMNYIFSTQVALFTIPVLDLIYSAFLVLDIIRNKI